MNHASIESAERWQELGLFKDSDFVWSKSLCISYTDKKAHTNEILTRKYFDNSPYCEIIGPAPHCEEMGVYLYDTLGLHTGRYEREFWAIYDKECDQVEVVRAENETQAREKAINWYLDNK